jgi:3-phenylpropionate/trans-cinnamate dioxygenase ferredoxin reductase component
VIAFGRLLLCTGAEPRRLHLPGVDGPGVHYLRDVADAAALRADLAVAERVAVIGGGLIGLEVAAAAAILGRHVEVLEAAPRVLGRGIPEPVADWLVRLHATHRVVIRTGVGPAEIVRTDQGVTGVRLCDGTDIPADAVVIGVGVLPRDRIAADAGIEVDDGILVEPSGQTSCPDVFAAGDVTRSRIAGGPAGGRGVRLESYQPAGQQGAAAALTMLGSESAFLEVPWSWSDQYDATLQACGFASPGAEQLVCGTDDAVLVLSFSGDRLVAACGVASGTAIAKPVRTAQLVIAAGGAVDRAAVEAVRGDLVQLTKTLRTAARSAAV